MSERVETLGDDVDDGLLDLEDDWVPPPALKHIRSIRFVFLGGAGDLQQLGLVGKPKKGVSLPAGRLEVGVK